MQLFINKKPLLTDTNQLLNLGDSIPNINKENNANNLLCGAYRVGDTLPANMPSNAGPYGLLVCVEVASNWILQFYIELNAQISRRAKINDQWNDWQN